MSELEFIHKCLTSYLTGVDCTDEDSFADMRNDVEAYLRFFVNIKEASASSKFGSIQFKHMFLSISKMFSDSNTVGNQNINKKIVDDVPGVLTERLVQESCRRYLLRMVRDDVENIMFSLQDQEVFKLAENCCFSLETFSKSVSAEDVENFLKNLNNKDLKCENKPV